MLRCVSKVWPASESDKSTDKPVPIPEDEREENTKKSEPGSLRSKAERKVSLVQ